MDYTPALTTSVLDKAASRHQSQTNNGAIASAAH